MATILILFTLGYFGAQVSAAKRAVGTLLGCNLALVMQLALYTQSHHFLLVILLYWLGLMLFAREHILEGGGSGIGFGGLTTMGILFGQSLGPQQDLVYSALCDDLSALSAQPLGTYSPARKVVEVIF